MTIESILVLRVLAALAVPTNEILPVQYLQYSTCSTVLAVPEVLNPEILEVSIGSIHSNEPRNTASPEVSALQNLELLRLLPVSAVHRNITSVRSTCSVVEQLRNVLETFLVLCLM